MEWSNSDSLKLIELYRQYECLWNPCHNQYKNKIRKNDAWDKISEVVKCDVKEVRKKMESLLGSFRRERQKEENSYRTGCGADFIHKSTWFAFKHMQFLMDKFVPKETRNTQAEDEETMKSKDISNVYQELNDNSHTQLSAPNVIDVQTAPKRVREFETSTNTLSSKRVPVSVRNSRSEEAYEILKNTVGNRQIRDDSSIYGEHVASKHRKYSAHTQSVVEHLIGNILYNADMRQYEPVVEPSFSPASTEQSPTVQDLPYQSLSSVSDNCPSNAPTPTSIVIELQTETQTNDNFSSAQLPSTDPQESIMSFIKKISTNK